MLTESEWEMVSPLLANAVDQIRRYRDQHQCSLQEAQLRGFGQHALQVYEQLTGFKETNANSLFHHRLSNYGPPCHACGELLHTPQARYCAVCSAERSKKFILIATYACRCWAENQASNRQIVQYLHAFIAINSAANQTHPEYFEVCAQGR